MILFVNSILSIFYLQLLYRLFFVFDTRKRVSLSLEICAFKRKKKFLRLFLQLRAKAKIFLHFVVHFFIADHSAIAALLVDSNKFGNRLFFRIFLPKNRLFRQKTSLKNYESFFIQKRRAPGARAWFGRSFGEEIFDFRPQVSEL